MRCCSILLGLFTALPLLAQPPCGELEAGFTWEAAEQGIAFNNTTTGTGYQTSWLWLFGDGTQSDAEEPFHHYTEPGEYNVCLVVTTWFETDSGSVTCVDEYCHGVVFGGEEDPCDALEAGFTWEAAEQGIAFNNTTTGTGYQTSWLWLFGDGSQSDAEEPFHHYTEPGEYNVCLVVTTWFETDSGSVTCVDEYCHGVVFGGEEDPCDALEAGFTWEAAEQGIAFNNTTTGTGYQTSWLWLFGDGSQSDAEEPFHHYMEPGEYTVCLVVTTLFETDSGSVTCVDEYCHGVVFGGEEDPCDALEAGFSWEAAEQGITFNNTTTGTGYQTSWLWLFGDGSQSDAEEPFHHYTEPGEYNVCLVVTTLFETDSGSVTCVEEYCHPVEFGGEVDCGGFEVEFSWMVQGPSVTFTGIAEQPGVEYGWHFGDGLEGSGQSVTHLYEPPGPYLVCVTGWWANDGADTCWADHCEWLDLFTVGMEEEAQSMVRLTPNPAHGHVEIALGHGPAAVLLHAPDGRVVAAQQMDGPQGRLDLENLPAAVYLLELRVAGQGPLWHRLMVQ
jgi:PKD repeat protein